MSYIPKRDLADGRIMAGKETQSVLRKMASPRAGTGPMRTVPVARLIRRAFETAAQEKMGIPLEVKAVRQSSVRLEDVRDLLGSYGFLVLLEGRPAAALAVEMPLLSGIVEQQTIGTVLSGAGGDRAATKVDAALFAPLVDDALRRFSISLEAKDKDIWGRNYAFGAMTADPRTLVLLSLIHI